MQIQYETIAVKVPKKLALEFESARRLLGFPSRAAYLWHLHLSHKGAEIMSDTDRNILLELAHYGNFKFHEATPDTARLALQTLRQSTPELVDQIEKGLESLEMKGLLTAMPTPIIGKFANDVITRNGRRLRLTPLGAETIRAMGYSPKLV